MINVLNSIVNNTEGLKREVAEIIIDEAGENNEEIAAYLENVTTYGCVNGTVSSLIYYSDTEAFFDRHVDEIFELIEDMAEEGIIDKKQIELSKNNLAWTAFELIAWEIRDELENAMEFITDSEGNEY